MVYLPDFNCCLFYFKNGEYAIGILPYSLLPANRNKNGTISATIRQKSEKITILLKGQ
jgi:hypothetical protein